MKTIFKFFTERHLLANALTVMILLAGLYSMFQINREEFLNMESTGKSKMEMAMFGYGKMRQCFSEGDVVDGSLMSGQVSGMVLDEPTCDELIQRIMKEFRQTVAGLKGLE